MSLRYIYGYLNLKWFELIFKQNNRKFETICKLLVDVTTYAKIWRSCRMKIKKLPNVLALHLKRFKVQEFQDKLKKVIKLSYRVVFPFELRLFNTVFNTFLLFDSISIRHVCLTKLWHFWYTVRRYRKPWSTIWIIRRLCAYWKVGHGASYLAWFQLLFAWFNCFCFVFPVAYNMDIM